MGAEFKNAKLADSAESRAQALDGIKRRRQAIASRPEINTPSTQRQTGEMSMFPGEIPGTQEPPGFEEAQFRRAEVTRERDRTGRREEIYNRFRQAEDQERAFLMNQQNQMSSQQNNGNFGFSGGAQQSPIRPGILFGAGRSMRVPEPGTPGYVEMLNRIRSGMSR